MNFFLISLAFSAHATLTEWDLLGHNNFRSLAKPSGKAWKTTSMQAKGFHFTKWDVPFDASTNLNGGAVQRADDGHIFVQLLGPIKENMGYGLGAEKKFGPPYVWEIDGITGASICMYDLSSIADVFESPLRFTPAGNPMVAVQKRDEAYKLVVLDRFSEKILQTMNSPIEPMLLFPTNTNPKSAIMASMWQIATVDFDSTGKMFKLNSSKITEDISTVMFGVDGTTMYNGAINLESTGIYRYELPITKTHKVKQVTTEASPYPWQLAGDKMGNLYSVYEGKTKSFGASGKTQWSTTSPAFWITMSDDEAFVISGDSHRIAVMRAETGELVFPIMNVTSYLRQNSDTSFACTYSEQPWAPRHPLVLSDGRLGVLCRDQNGYVFPTVDLATGKVNPKRARFTMSSVNVLTGDSSNNVYGYGFENGVPVVERIAV